MAKPRQHCGRTQLIPSPPAIVIVVEDPKDSVRGAIATVSRGISRRDMYCALEIARRESRYNKDSYNPRSGARGVYQLLHGKKNWTLNKQIQMAVKYMKHRYGTWCQALKFHNLHGWW